MGKKKQALYGLKTLEQIAWELEQVEKERTRLLRERREVARSLYAINVDPGLVGRAAAVTDALANDWARSDKR